MAHTNIRSYKTIKWVLKEQIKLNAKCLWTWKQAIDIKKEEFTCVYKNYNDSMPLYTPLQLLNKINGETDIQSNS